MTNEMSDADRPSIAEENASESEPRDSSIPHGLVETGFTPTTSESIDEDLADGTLPDTDEGQHPIDKERESWVSHWYEVRVPVNIETGEIYVPEPESSAHKWHLLPATLTEWAIWVIFTPLGFWLMENGMDQHHR